MDEYKGYMMDNINHLAESRLKALWALEIIGSANGHRVGKALTRSQGLYQAMPILLRL
jgi:hypothetical protein